MDDEDNTTPCGICALNMLESRKTLWIKCTVCRPGWFHVTCLGLTGRAAQALRDSRSWECGFTCSVNNSTRQQGLPANITAPDPQSKPLEPIYPGVKIIQRIPKGARNLAAVKLADLLDRCVEESITETWSELFHFAWERLYQPGIDPKGQPRSLHYSLTSKIKNQLNAAHPSPHAILEMFGKKANRKKAGSGNKNSKDGEKLARRIDQKLSEGDIRGAVRAVSSTTGLAKFSQETAQLLEAKHPRQVEGNMIPTLLQLPDVEPLTTSEDEVLTAINSFPPGSSGGPDGLRPIHIKDMISRSAGDAGARLLSSITKFVNLVLRGSVCPQVLPVLFGASLCALEKKCGGVRPIAVGNTLRRVVGKVVSRSVQQEMGDFLRPVQLGYGTRAGCEAAIHSVRQYLQKSHAGPKVVLKGDYSNAFNSLDRATFLRRLAEVAPKTLAYATQAYGQSSLLFFGQHRLDSASGVQQGDPLGPLLFSLGIHELATSLSSELNVWYLDDVTVCGDPATVLHDLRKIQTDSTSLGLSLNNDKSEITVINCSEDDKQAICQQFEELAPGIKVVPLQKATLLGSPLSVDGINESI